MFLYLTYCFVAGVVLDYLGTVDTQAVTQDKPLRSAIASFLNNFGSSMAGLLIYVVCNDLFYSILGIILNSLGGSLGGIIAMRGKQIINFININWSNYYVKYIKFKTSST